MKAKRYSWIFPVLARSLARASSLNANLSIAADCLAYMEHNRSFILLKPLSLSETPETVYPSRKVSINSFHNTDSMFLRRIAQRSITSSSSSGCRPRRFRPTTAATSATRSVWHSGYLDQQKADDLAQVIETTKYELQALHKEQQDAHAIKQKELDNLNQDYKNLTGESYRK
jgi:hypothetical protein